MENTKSEAFEVQLRIKGLDAQVKIVTEETTDGVPYYKAYVNDKDLAEIRQGEDGSWQKIWGELEGHDIKRLGKAIEDHG